MFIDRFRFSRFLEIVRAVSAFQDDIEVAERNNLMLMMMILMLGWNYNTTQIVIRIEKGISSN